MSFIFEPWWQFLSQLDFRPRKEELGDEPCSQRLEAKKVANPEQKRDYDAEDGLLVPIIVQVRRRWLYVRFAELSFRVSDNLLNLR